MRKEYLVICMPRRLRRGRLRHEPFSMKINTTPVKDVKSVVEKLREKYRAKDVKKDCSEFGVAVLVDWRSQLSFEPNRTTTNRRVYAIQIY
jgi:hypothetical protein